MLDLLGSLRDGFALSVYTRFAFWVGSHLVSSALHFQLDLDISFGFSLKYPSLFLRLHYKMDIQPHDLYALALPYCSVFTSAYVADVHWSGK